MLRLVVSAHCLGEGGDITIPQKRISGPDVFVRKRHGVEVRCKLLLAQVTHKSPFVMACRVRLASSTWAEAGLLGKAGG
jgi:hypothetical protein